MIKLTQKQLLSKLKKDELSDGFPTCQGLKRLVETYIGYITTNTVVLEDFTVGNTPYPIAVTSTQITIRPYIIDDDIENTDIDIYNTRTYSDIADCGTYNTEEPYSEHPAATAATRSEARVYRKILGLSTVSYEEAKLKTGKQGDEPSLDATISDDNDAIEHSTSTQIKAIEVICKRKKCDVVTAIENAIKQSIPLRELSKKEADIVLEYVNKVEV